MGLRLERASGGTPDRIKVFELVGVGSGRRYAYTTWNDLTRCGCPTRWESTFAPGAVLKMTAKWGATPWLIATPGNAPGFRERILAGATPLTYPRVKRVWARVEDVWKETTPP